MAAAGDKGAAGANPGQGDYYEITAPMDAPMLRVGRARRAGARCLGALASFVEGKMALDWRSSSLDLQLVEHAVEVGQAKPRAFRELLAHFGVFAF